MKDSRAALRYAKAILNLAIEHKMADEVDLNMIHISETIDASKKLQLMLGSPVVKADAKKKALITIFNDDINNITKGLINQLIDNKRLPILNDIAKQYIIIYDHYKGTEAAKVTTAVPLTEALEKKILIKVKDIVGKKVTLENIVDPSIIGGFILKIGDKQYDASILGKMNNLRRQFDDNLYVPNF